MERVFALPIGLPGVGMHVGCDPLSWLFLGILGPQILAVGMGEDRKSPLFWVFVGGMGLAVAAADNFTMVFGFELMSAASWLLVLRGDRKPATLYAGVALFSGACLVPALFLPAGGVAFALVLLGAGAKAGLAPLHVWLPRAHPAPPAGISALMSGGMIKVALYVIIREGFVVMRPEMALWWGVALIVAGGASVLVGALRAMVETDLKVVLACSTVEHVGLVAVGLGVAMRALTLGDSGLAVVALEGALLLAVAHGLFKPLLFLGAGAVKLAAGTTSLDWLGGLMKGMPAVGGLMLVGCAGLAAVPLGPGFAPAFLLLHAVMGGAGEGGILGRIGFEALLAVLGLSAALGAGAGVRIVGVGFLGRPRSLQVASAEDGRWPVLLGMGLLAGLCVPVGLLPGVLLGWMGPVFRELAPAGMVQPLAYAPLPLALLVGGLGVAAVVFVRRFGARGAREVPAWQGGLGKPPAWLPFGDPTTQVSGTGFAAPVMRAVGMAVLGGSGVDPGEVFVLEPLRRVHLVVVRAAERVRRATIWERLAFVFAALVAFLLALGLGEGR